MQEKNGGLGVAPLVGAWIEIIKWVQETLRALVAPLVGAWIEITVPRLYIRVCIVAPLVGAWIEIYNICLSDHDGLCRSSRGSVD